MTLRASLLALTLGTVPAFAQAPGQAPAQLQATPPAPSVMDRRWSVGVGIGWESFTAKTDGGDKITFGMFDLAGRFRIKPHVEVGLGLVAGGAQDKVSTGGLYIDMRYRFLAEKPWNVYGVIGLGVISVAGKDATDDEKQGRGSLRVGFGVERRFTSLALFGEVRVAWVAENKDLAMRPIEPLWWQFSRYGLGGGHVVFGGSFYF